MVKNPNNYEVLDDAENILCRIGEKRKIKLLQHFKTIDRIKEATVEELLKVDGMNEKLAENIYKFFNH